MRQRWSHIMFENSSTTVENIMFSSQSLMREGGRDGFDVSPLVTLFVDM